MKYPSNTEGLLFTPIVGYHCSELRFNNKDDVYDEAHLSCIPVTMTALDRGIETDEPLEVKRDDKTVTISAQPGYYAVSTTWEDPKTGRKIFKELGIHYPGCDIDWQKVRSDQLINQ